MRSAVLVISAAVSSAGLAQAGGIERTPQSVAILFEAGRYAEFSFGAFNPDVSGSVGGGTVPSGDMSSGYGNLSFGYKQALSDNLDFAVVIDQPVGANVNYPAAFAPYPYAGSTARVESMAVTGFVRYKLPSNFSVIGGIRAQSIEGTVSLPVASYTMSTSKEYDFGYVIGAAWERPEIAARVALTYNSAFDHTFDVQENGAPSLPFTTTIPQSVNLEFQTGIAADTLLFGSIRWQEWSAFDITPVGLFASTGQPLVDYNDNTVTYNLGVGRRFTENWSGAITLGYEPSHGNVVGNLGPTDGFKSVGLAVTYTDGPLKVIGGVRYVELGSATTGIGAEFSDNSGVGAGIRVGYSF